MRKKQVLTFNVKRHHLVYIMTKSFRLRNNYTLDEAMNYGMKHNASLHIIIVEPEEESTKSLTFYKEHTIDLASKLSVYAKDVITTSQANLFLNLPNDVEAIFMDFAYLSADISLFEKMKTYANNNEINLYQVESNVFVPITDASDHEEYGAYTIRKKIQRLMPYYDKEVLLKTPLTVGEKAALQTVKVFIEEKLHFYHEHNDPSKAYTSRLSAYLKFGFISPVTIYHMMQSINQELKADFLEELIVRRELAYNFVYYNPDYDKFERMTEKWAYLTMHDHENDPRVYDYTMDDYIQFKTHDPYFNAAMKQMIYTGYMHGYMRMYWAKKIIEWSKSYALAYQIAITLNNRYFIDGLTPNGYAGVSWCFGKHDRAWPERPIFGKLRYMNDLGLKRKFNIDQYVHQMNEIAEQHAK